MAGIVTQGNVWVKWTAQLHHFSPLPLLVENDRIYIPAPVQKAGCPSLLGSFASEPRAAPPRPPWLSPAAACGESVIPKALLVLAQQAAVASLMPLLLFNRTREICSLGQVWERPTLKIHKAFSHLKKKNPQVHLNHLKIAVKNLYYTRK